MDKPLKDWTLEEVQNVCKEHSNTDHSIYVEDCDCYNKCPCGVFCALNFYYKPKTWFNEDENA